MMRSDSEILCGPLAVAVVASGVSSTPYFVELFLRGVLCHFNSLCRSDSTIGNQNLETEVCYVASWKALCLPFVF